MRLPTPDRDGCQKVKAYISGPMRGIHNFNYDTFNQVEEALYRWWNSTNGDFTVINPARNFGGDTTLQIATYMDADLRQVLDADTIVLLPGWRDSEGAKLEVRVALATAKRFYEANAASFAGADPLNDPPRIDWTFTEVTGPLDHEPAGNIGTPRAAVLAEASRLVTGDRNVQYGEPTADFRRSAEAMSAFGYRVTELSGMAEPCKTCGARSLVSHDVAVLMSTVKISRIMWDPTKRDHAVDLAGYAACLYECVEAERGAA